MQRDDRLDIQQVERPAVRPDAEIEIALELHADQVGHRVLQLLGQIRGVRGRRRRGADRDGIGSDSRAGSQRSREHSGEKKLHGSDMIPEAGSG